MTRKEQEILLKKRFILKCTLDLMEELKIDEITTKEIADRSQYSKGSLYTYFINKDEILLALMYSSLSLWSDVQRWAISNHEHNLLKLGYIGLSRKVFLEEYAVMYRCNMLYKDIDFSSLEKSSYLPQLQKLSKIDIEGPFRNTIEEGVKKGEIVWESSPQMLICLLESFSEGVFSKIETGIKTGDTYCEGEQLHEEYISFIGRTLSPNKPINFHYNKQSFKNELKSAIPINPDYAIDKYILQ
ncbi:MAG: hypothetical protein Kapaf2KO_09400 [Candidatus Kapaibacteriales bacterium]